MAGIKGTTVVLLQKMPVGEDGFGRMRYDDRRISIENVLIGEPTTDDVTDTINLYGKKVAYVLGIPKGDMHDWTDAEVEFFGQRFRTIGYPVQGIEENIPLSWNKKVKVEAYG